MLRSSCLSLARSSSSASGSAASTVACLVLTRPFSLTPLKYDKYEEPSHEKSSKSAPDFKRLALSSMRFKFAKISPEALPSVIKTHEELARAPGSSANLVPILAVLRKGASMWEDPDKMSAYFASIDETFRPQDEKLAERVEKAKRDVDGGKYAEQDATAWEDWVRKRDELAQVSRDKIAGNTDLDPKVRAFKVKELEKALVRDTRKALARRDVLEQRKRDTQHSDAEGGSEP